MTQVQDTKKKIIVVEDDQSIADVISIVLVEAGYAVANVLGSKQMHEKIAESATSLILIDIWLSGENGLEIMKELKAAPQTAHIPVGIISARTNVEEESLQAGADGFLPKPFKIVELLTLVEKIKIA